MDLGLKGQVALLSAASKGLGYGIARAMARDGANVSICSRDAVQVEKAVQQLRDETGADVIGVACDVRDAASIEAWINGAAERWGRVDSLLVNAGGPPAKPFRDLSDEDWQSGYELTLLSAVRMIRAALPHMVNGGAILTITSSLVVEPSENMALSNVLRSGVAALVKTLSDELASSGVRVNNLIPGRLDTDRVAQLDQGTANRLGLSFDEVRQRSLVKIPLKRLGTIDEFGAAGTFLLSPAASYITGASLRVDGGMMRSVSG